MTPLIIDAFYKLSVDLKTIEKKETQNIEIDVLLELLIANSSPGVTCREVPNRTSIL